MSTKTTPKPGQRPIGAASQSVSAVDRAKQLNLPPKPTSAAGSTGATVSATATPSQKKSATELRAKLAIASPPPSTPPQSVPQRHQAARQDDDLDGSILTLKARDILPYDKNPRGSMNPKYHQIKASIKAEGRLNGTLTVTRRPGSSQYMLFGGGNTRLQIVNELFDETGSPNFEYLTLTYRRWTAESSVIAAHLIENEARGDTTFWEKAKGLKTLKDELERETNRPMSTAALVSEAKALGMEIESTMVKLYLFALDRLVTIGQWLTKTDTELLRKRITVLTGLAGRLDVKQVDIDAVIERCLSMSGEQLRAEESLRANTEDAKPVELDATELCNAIDSASAALLGISVSEMRQMLALLEIDPKAGPDALRQAANTSGGNVDRTAAPMVTDPRSSGGDSVPANQAHAGSTGAAAGPNAPAQGGGSKPSVKARAEAPAPGQPHFQMPLNPQAMLAPVTPAPVLEAAAPGGDDPGDLVEGNEPTDPSHPLHISQAPKAVQAILMQIAELAGLGDVIYVVDEMPLGFFVELPAKGIEFFDGTQPATNVRLRKAAWHVLAALSGQYDQELVKRLPETTLWRTLLEDRMADGHPFTAHFQLSVAGAFQNGSWHMPVTDFHECMWHPTLGHLYCNLLVWAHRWRQYQPARFPERFAPAHPQQNQ